MAWKKIEKKRGAMTCEIPLVKVCNSFCKTTKENRCQLYFNNSCVKKIIGKSKFSEVFLDENKIAFKFIEAEKFNCFKLSNSNQGKSRLMSAVRIHKIISLDKYFGKKYELKYIEKDNMYFIDLDNEYKKL